VSATLEVEGNFEDFEPELALDGQHGTNSMIHDYFRELQRFAD